MLISNLFTRLLPNIKEKVMYYEWLLGNLCQEDSTSVCETLIKLSESDDYSDVRHLLNEPVIFEDQDLEFSSDNIVISYCEVCH